MFSGQNVSSEEAQFHGSAQDPVVFMSATVYGATIHAMTLNEMHQAIAYAVDTDKKWLIAHHNLHSLYLIQKELHDGVTSQLQRFYQRAAFTNIDGMSMVLLARLQGHPVRRDHRFSYSLTLRSTLEEAQRHGWRVFYLGSSSLVVEKAKSILKTEFPQLAFEARDGFFHKDRSGPENQEVLEQIAAFRPNILLVGMGMPLQERWVEENYEAIRANVILTSGATLEYIAGTLQPPPEWMSRSGLQWLHRLVSEPKRLGFRYLVEPVLILRYILQARLRRSK